MELDFGIGDDTQMEIVELDGPVGAGSSSDGGTLPDGSFGVTVDTPAFAPNGAPIPQITKRRPPLHGAAEFISWTWEMVNAGYDDIGWSTDGSRIVVKNPERLANVVLPQFFRHSQYASWVRALNAYTFKKAATGQWEHPYFHRDKPHLLKKIQRKGKEKATQSTALIAVPGGGGRKDLTNLSSILAEERSKLAWMKQEMLRLEDEVQQVQREDLQQRYAVVSLAHNMLENFRKGNGGPMQLTPSRSGSLRNSGPASPKLPAITMLQNHGEEFMQMAPAFAPLSPKRLELLGYSGGGAAGSSSEPPPLALSEALLGPPGAWRQDGSQSPLVPSPPRLSRVNSADLANVDLTDLAQLYEDLDLSELGLHLSQPPSPTQQPRSPSPIGTAAPVKRGLSDISMSSLSTGSAGHAVAGCNSSAPVEPNMPLNAFLGVPPPPPPSELAMPTVNDLQRAAVDHYFSQLSGMAERALSQPAQPPAFAMGVGAPSAV